MSTIPCQVCGSEAFKMGGFTLRDRFEDFFAPISPAMKAWLAFRNEMEYTYYHKACEPFAREANKVINDTYTEFMEYAEAHDGV